MDGLSVPRYQLLPAVPPLASHSTSLSPGFLTYSIRVRNARIPAFSQVWGTADTGPV